MELDDQFNDGVLHWGGGMLVAQAVATVRLHGDDDDHLRAVVALSLVFDGDDPFTARLCRAPENNPWPSRLAAFRELLRAATRNRRRLVVRVEDPDALDAGPFNDRRRWDDARFARQRGELLDVLLKAAIDDGLITLVRTQPRRRIDFHLQRSVIREGNLDCVQSRGSPERVGGVPFPAVLAPVARWLLTEGAMTEVDLRALDEIHGAVEVLVAAWERLKPSVRRDAMRLSTVRDPMHRNGTMGPFAWMDVGGPDSGDAVASMSVDQLASAGFLQASPLQAGQLQMPRMVRHFVERHARLLEPEGTRSLHAKLAARDQQAAERTGTTVGTVRTMEAHWHAIAAQDVDRAFETAQFYGADLRAVAIQLGRSAHRIRRNESVAKADAAFEQAARVFERIVSDFDREDAYAWEYAAYNRWQLHRFALSQATAEQRGQIATGFERACQLDARNPLFRGRLLAFRIDCGETIDSDLDRWMGTFLDQLGERDRTAAERLTWFAEPILGALRRRSSFDQLRRLASRWPVLGEVQSKIEQRKRGLLDGTESD